MVSGKRLRHHPLIKNMHCILTAKIKVPQPERISPPSQYCMAPLENHAPYLLAQPAWVNTLNRHFQIPEWSSNPVTPLGCSVFWLPDFLGLLWCWRQSPLLSSIQYLWHRQEGRYKYACFRAVLTGRCWTAWGCLWEMARVSQPMHVCTFLLGREERLGIWGFLSMSCLALTRDKPQ